MEQVPIERLGQHQSTSTPLPFILHPSGENSSRKQLEFKVRRLRVWSEMYRVVLRCGCQC
jgi:hypothetical protein